MIDRDAIGAFVRSARSSTSLRREPGPSPDAVRVVMAQVFAYRAQVQYLARRLAYGGHAEAAGGGLQDSAPRAALYGLHARMEGVGPDDWEHPSLVQIWFRHGADYVIPREALDTFTIGTMPDDPAQQRALNDLGDMTREVVANGPMRVRDVAAALGPRLPDVHAIKLSTISGKVVIRWDASKIELIASDDPTTGVAAARVDLARRFVHHYGPVAPAHLAKWAALPRAAAAAAFDELELVPVDVGGRGRSILRDDVDALTAATPADGVRLLPSGGDPYLSFDHAAAPTTPAVGPNVSQRLVNSMVCRILLDGELVGAWGRVQHNVTLFAWRRLSKRDVQRVEDEAASFSGPLGGKPVRIRWLDEAAR